MKPKGEVNYIAIKQRKPLWIAIILVLIFFIIFQIIIITKLTINVIKLNDENNDLKRIIQMKDSMMADLQESNIDLQKKLEE